MIIVRNLKIPLNADFGDLRSVLEKKLGVRFTPDTRIRLYKKAADARKKSDICFNCAFTIECADEQSLLGRLKKFDASPFTEPTYRFPQIGSRNKRPIIVGFGPAGMFAALSLARAGMCPLVLERGYAVEQRQRDVTEFFGGGKLKDNSNIQFGEGGAGTFSDGKLNTGIKDGRIRTVLHTFAEHGAGECILYDAKPHIGTDVLVNVVRSIREEIKKLGGEVLFEHRVTDIEIHNGAVCGVVVNAPDGEHCFDCERLILAVGHSSRDTFIMLKERGIEMQPKPFAVGARIEHSQSLINRAQYGKFAGHKALGAADYRLATHLANGRGVFTFCMCPGGEVVNASSEQGGVAVNGMSRSARNGKNADSAVLVGVEVEDYYNGDVLDGMHFQRRIERRAFEVGGGLPVAQTVGSLLFGAENTIGSVHPSVATGVRMGDIGAVLPEFIVSAMKEGIVEFDRKLHGFALPDAVLIAPETRSSSPVRIIRGDNGASSVGGLFPCGEGAGYAGGITSAAVDGLRAAEWLAASYD